MRVVLAPIQTMSSHSHAGFIIYTGPYGGKYATRKCQSARHPESLPGLAFFDTIPLQSIELLCDLLYFCPKDILIHYLEHKNGTSQAREPDPNE